MQDSHLRALTTLFLIILTLSACAPYRPASGKAAKCNQLNSQLVFGGNTGNTRQAEILSAETPMVARTYERADCAQ
jgi:hypothetical protein